MDKKVLQNFALFAKDSLETQIKVSLKLLGIHSDKDIKKAYIQGDFTIIDGDSKTYPSDLKVKRDHILELIKTDGYAYTIEQFAYTWFNRLIALRFMEVHDYISHGFKVFPKGNGSIEPEILGKLTLVEKELNLDIELCRQLKEKAQIEELYRYVLFQQCNALSGVLPMLFSKEYAYLELMLPSTLLKGTTVITELIKIDESNFLDDVEVIGWLYQFYVSSDREEFRKAKVVNKDLIPTLTQIFTPDWIVRYMTENSLGRLWLESYPDSSVKKEFKYYVEDAEQTEEVKKQIESIRYKNVDPKDIKVIEPCSGSGHILVYAFDVLMLMYEEKGYSKNDIPKLILDNNLFGLDVDKRASQLASFSLIMKARSIDSRFFQPSRISYPKVFEIKDSKMLISMDYKKKILDLNNNDWKKDEHLSDEELKVIDYVIETFDDGKVIGSLLKVKRDNYVPLISKMNHLHKVTIRGIFNGEFVEYGLKRIVQLLRLAEVMSRKYDVLITNPPYMGVSKLDNGVKEYLTSNYPNSKSDMATMFMESNYVITNGFRSLINPDSWMFLSSYEKTRTIILSSKTIINMIHIGLGGLDATVQTTAFVIRNTYSKYKSIYYRLADNTNSTTKNSIFIVEKNKTDSDFRFISESDLFLKIPSSPIAYWKSIKFLSIFKNRTLSEIADSKPGMSTTNNDKFIRFWYEVNLQKVKFDATSQADANKSKKKWFPYNKGGEFRRWYGNNDYVVNWENNGLELKEYTKGASGGRMVSLDYFFRECLTWSMITTGTIAFRYKEPGSILSNAGPSVYSTNHLKYLLGLCNSSVITEALKLLAPTLNCSSGVIAAVPVVISNEELITELVNRNIEISKNDWDDYEISWNFSKHPLLKMNICEKGSSYKLVDIFNNWKDMCQSRFSSLKSNEELINKHFIEMYNLSSEINHKIDDKFVSVNLANVKSDIQSLISYLVGTSMGRYSLIQNFVIHSSTELDYTKYGDYYVDADGIIPLQNTLGSDYSLTNRVLNLIKQIYGVSNYKDNIEFIAQALGKNNNESAEETINHFINSEFYPYHIKTYQKRPIYWMLSSGKNGAFQCLLYIQRYNEDTLAKINSKYLLPESARLKYELNDINNQLLKADDKIKRALEKEKVVLENKYNEIIEYGQVLDHMANRYISIDLDDGVKVNYEKFQGIEIVTDSGTRIKKDLLVPIK
jgi:hypothetical protein